MEDRAVQLIHPDTERTCRLRRETDSSPRHGAPKPRLAGVRPYIAISKTVPSHELITSNSSGKEDTAQHEPAESLEARREIASSALHRVSIFNRSLGQPHSGPGGYIFDFIDRRLGRWRIGDHRSDRNFDWRTGRGWGRLPLHCLGWSRRQRAAHRFQYRAM